MDNIYSPVELYEAGVKMMLKGVEPQTEDDWKKLVHFWAFNIGSDKLTEAVELLCLIFKAPLKSDYIQTVSKKYMAEALERQEKALKEIIGKPVTHQHLKFLRSTMSTNLSYEDLVKVFEKAGLELSWPNQTSWEAWGKLCKALFMMKGEKFKAPQKAMAKIINEGDTSND